MLQNCTGFHICTGDRKIINFDIFCLLVYLYSSTVQPILSVCGGRDELRGRQLCGDCEK